MGNNSSAPSQPQTVLPAVEKTQEPPAPPPASTPPAPSPSSTPEAVNQTFAQPPQPVNEFPRNPGTFEELHKKCKELFPQTIEGCKVNISRTLSSHFQATHSLVLASPESSGYRFGATYVGSKTIGPQESFPVLLGDIDPSGNLNANIIHAFTKRIHTRSVAQFMGPAGNFQSNADYKGDTFTASCFVANPNIVNITGVMGLHYLQRITPSFDLGAECVYQRAPQIPGGQHAAMSMAARLSGAKWSLAAQASPEAGLHATYYQKVNDELAIGTEIALFGPRPNVASVGYCLEIPATGATFKAQIDTNMNVQSALEKKMMDVAFPVSWTFSIEGNPLKSDFKFGLGMMIGS